MIYMVKNHDLGSRIIIFLVSTGKSAQSSCFFCSYYFVASILLPQIPKKFTNITATTNPQLPQTKYADFASSLWKLPLCSCIAVVTGCALGDIDQFQPELLEWHPSDWKLRVWTDRVPAETPGTMWVFPKIGVPPFHTPK